MNGIQPRTFSASKTVNEQLRKTQLDLNQKEKEPSLPQDGASKIPVQSQPLSFKREDAPSHEVEKRSSRSQGVSEIEAGFLAEMDKVKKIADDIDGFMHIIEIDSLGSGLTRSGVDKLESEIIAVSARCRSFKQKLQEHCEFVEELRDQSLDVDAWRIYVESRVEQASDSRYQDLWVHRKLHPEMDIKRKHVINADETLKRQISDLESHLHTLEISRRQNMSSKQRSTAGDFQSVQNLYSTVNFQMEAADKLCVHLADLMESMNISSSVTSLRPRKMQSSLLQTKPPQTKTESVFSTPSKSILSDDFAPAESTRRRRDSLDSGIGATKTTIKRMVGVVNNRKAKLLESTSNALQTMKPQSTLKQPSVTEEKILVLAPAATSLDTTRPSFSSRTDIVSQSSSPPFGDGGLRSQPLPPSSSALALKVPDMSRASTNVIRPASAFIAPASITKTSSMTTQATPPSAWLPSLELKAAPAVVSFGPLEVKATSSTVQATPATSTSLELKRTTSPTSSDLKATSITSSPTFSVSTRLGAPLPSLFQQLESKPSTSEQAQSQPKISTAPIAATCSVSSGSSQLVVSSSTSATLLPAAPRTTSLVKPLAFSFPVSSSPATALSFASSSAATSTLSMMSATTKVPSSGYSSSPPQSTSQLTVSSSPPSTTSKPDIFASPFPNVPAASGPSPVSSPFPALLQSQQQQTTQAVRPPPDEDDMDEEAPSSAFSGFGNLGLGSALPSAPTGNPFGVTPSPQATPFGGLSAPPPGQLFRPAAFSLSSPGTGFTSSPEGGAFSNRPAAAPSGFGQAPSSGFGQPAGSALGSALGAFGQTRQVGFGGPVSGAAGFASASPGGGFASAATGGGFASATSGAGFAAAASGGGFAGAATGSGFQALGQNISSGGFGGFAGSNAATPGFGSVQPPGGFLPGAAQPPNNPLFTAMRK
ncbi:nuclear pore complex protein NUP214-like [Selaginella moellendorffii]|uniref:nuclear pore complex protein NUP214-like n=1 Tax=Selaginella moellendorffii TaxID=88036 RepID=UPI000D1CBF2B|nr:nuclear pore complex protein NUP214-like [Selaginella moellendorffii]|eukprot:XP_024524107.1 nuclear pore complex protein NUP214-like [Selaginella moellendorffii]